MAGEGEITVAGTRKGTGKGKEEGSITAGKGRERELEEGNTAGKRVEGETLDTSTAPHRDFRVGQISF